MHLRVAMLIVGTLGSGPVEDTVGPEPVRLSKDELFPAKNYLVRAEAKKPKSWEILHVYVGPMELKGQTVSGEFTPPARNTGSGPGTSPVALGSGLFWLIEPKKGKLSFAAPKDVSMQVLFSDSALKSEQSVYPFRAEAAEVLETVYRATDERRLIVVDGHVKSGNRVRAAAALRQLTENVKDPYVTEYVLRLTRCQKLPVAIQVQAYWAVVDRLPDWQGSKAEKRMVDYWLTGAWKEGNPAPKDSFAESMGSDEEAVLHWLGTAAWLGGDVPFDPNHPPPYTVGEAFGFAVKALANPHRSEGFRKDVLDRFANNAKKVWVQRVKVDGFAYLVGAAREGPSVAEHAAAAKLLGMFAPFDEAQTKELRALLAAGPDEAVAAELRALLDKKK